MQDNKKRGIYIHIAEMLIFFLKIDKTRDKFYDKIIVYRR